MLQLLLLLRMLLWASSSIIVHAIDQEIHAPVMACGPHITEASIDNDEHGDGQWHSEHHCHQWHYVLILAGPIG